MTPLQLQFSREYVRVFLSGVTSSQTVLLPTGNLPNAAPLTVSELEWQLEEEGPGRRAITRHGCAVCFQGRGPNPFDTAFEGQLMMSTLLMMQLRWED